MPPMSPGMPPGPGCPPRPATISVSSALWVGMSTAVSSAKAGMALTARQAVMDRAINFLRFNISNTSSGFFSSLSGTVFPSTLIS